MRDQEIPDVADPLLFGGFRRDLHLLPRDDLPFDGQLDESPGRAGPVAFLFAVRYQAQETAHPLPLPVAEQQGVVAAELCQNRKQVAGLRRNDPCPQGVVGIHEDGLGARRDQVGEDLRLGVCRDAGPVDEIMPERPVEAVAADVKTREVGCYPAEDRKSRLSRGRLFVLLNQQNQQNQQNSNRLCPPLSFARGLWQIGSVGMLHQEGRRRGHV